MRCRHRIAGVLFFVSLALLVNPGVSRAADDSVICVYRYDLLLNENGFESIDSIDSTVVHTTSVMYSGALYNADALRAAINAAAGAGGLESASQSTNNAALSPGGGSQSQTLYFSYSLSPNVRTVVQGNSNGSERYTWQDDQHAHITMDYPRVELQVLTRNTDGSVLFTPGDVKRSINFDGSLTLGDALAFSAPVQSAAGLSLRHLIVWEVFKAPQRYMQNINSIRGSERFCQLGPQGIINASDVATVWASTAKHDDADVGPKWQQTLSDGKVLKLNGVTRSDKWLFCWWDADGQPISGNLWIAYQQANSDPVNYSASVSGPEKEWSLQTPHNLPGRMNNRNTGSFSASITNVLNEKGNAIIGVPVGPWEEVGEIKKGGRIKVGDITYNMRDIQSFDNGGFYVQFYPTRGNSGMSDLVTISPELKDGKMLDVNYLPQITSSNYGSSTPVFQGAGIQARDVKTFHVWRRKQQWVTFANLPGEPKNPPKVSVTPAEVSDALQRKRDQQKQMQAKLEQEKMESQQKKRKEWEATPLDPKTPIGAMRTLFNAARQGDLAAVRNRLISSESGNETELDLVARFITVSQSARATAITRFGQANVNTLNAPGRMGSSPLSDLEAQTAGENWQPRKDGGLENDHLAIVKGGNGEYFLDVAGMFKNPGSLEQMGRHARMVSVSERADKIHQLMKDPAITFDEFRKALSNPTTRPTTQATAK